MSNPFDAVGKHYFAGSSVRGHLYQDMGFLGFQHPSHRDGTEARVDFVVSQLSSDMRGVDIGCSNGGLTLGVSRHVTHVTGVDHDPASLDVARHVASELDLQSRVDFLECDIASDEFLEFIRESDLDFALWFSNFMWVARAVGWDRANHVLRTVSEQVPLLLFETAQGPKDGAVGEEYTVAGIEGVLGLLRANTVYTEFTDLGVADRDARSRRRNVVLARRSREGVN